MKITKTNNISKKLIKGLTAGFLTGMCVIFLLTVIMSFIFEKSGSIPYGALDYITLCAAAAGAFAGGYISARVIKNSGLLYGAVTGTALFIVFLIIGLSRAHGTITLLTFYRFAAFELASIAGGILGVNKKNKIKIK